MKISSQNFNFTARLSRNPSDFGYEKTKQETMADYDEKIRQLRSLKKQAQEFDDFMRSDEIKAMMQKLPVYDEVVMRNECSFEDKGWDDIQARPFELMYIQQEDKYEFIQPTGRNTKDKYFAFIQNSDGTINKEGIKAWLENLVYLFGNK